MKKVLIITFYFPPCSEIGSQRPYRLAKYLLDLGWEPIILTAKLPNKPPDGIKVIETDYLDIVSYFKSIIGFNPGKGLHDQLGISTQKNYKYQGWKSKAIKFLKECINFPDSARGWNKFAFKVASNYLFQEKVDVIISTSPPATSHIIASKLKDKHKIPWVADFRDLWTQNHFYNKFDLIKYFERRLELKTLSNADVLVTVTKKFTEEIQILFKDKKVNCITNGYDAADFPEISSKLTDNFTITYTGSLHGGKMDPFLLFEAVNLLINENKLNKDIIKIRFYCHKEDWLLDDIRKYGLEGVVSCYGFLPREVVLERQKESQLLLLMCDKNREVTYYPAKVFEYFGARRPIIAIGGMGGIVKELLEITNTGKFAVDADNLRNFLLEYYHEFIKSGEVKCHSNNISSYNYFSIAKEYSKILNDLVKK